MLRSAMAVLFWIFLTGMIAAQTDDNIVLDLALNEKSAYRVDANPAEWRLNIAIETTMAKGGLVDLAAHPNISTVSIQSLQNNWHDISIRFDRGFELVSAGYSDRTTLQLTLRPVQTQDPEPVKSETAPTPRKPVIVIDAGHGGIDSGAVRNDVREAELMLIFANELSEAMIRSGRFRVEMTRTDDRFLRLSERIAFARDVGASAFISLHADALSVGRAQGAAVFTLSEKASSAAATELVEVHERSEILIGNNLNAVEDDIASILVDMAQTDTKPRSQALSRALVSALAEGDSNLRKRARQFGNFGVLKAPDIPSVLIELGFMSDETDLKNLLDPNWRTGAVDAILQGLLDWSDAEEAAELGQK